MPASCTEEDGRGPRLRKLARDARGLLLPEAARARRAQSGARAAELAWGWLASAAVARIAAARIAAARIAAAQDVGTHGNAPADPPPPSSSTRGTDLASAVHGALARMLDDATLAPCWRDIGSLGWLYQHFFTPERAAAVVRLNAGHKLATNDLARATQLFTPAWIVRALAENTLGRLWLALHPDSRLRVRLSYLVPATAPYAQPASPLLAREISVLDPACGAMHFGLAAFDLLAEMYAEELERAGTSGWPARPSVTRPGAIAASILRHNLFGLDADTAVLGVAATALRLKAMSYRAGADAGTSLPSAHLACAGGHPLGSLALPGAAPATTHARAIGARKFQIVLTNPPYLDSRAYPMPLKEALAAAYPAARRNMYAAFVLRGLDWLAPGGRLGIITPQTFMFLSSFAGARVAICQQAAVELLAQLGYGAFPGAEVDCAFYVLRRESGDTARGAQAGTFIRLADAADATAKRAGFEHALCALQAGRRDAITFIRPQSAIEPAPGAPWIYWLGTSTERLLAEAPVFGSLARVAVGLQTGDNRRFLRYWWEVGRERIAFGCADRAAALATGMCWFPHVKGGTFRRWWGNQEYVVHWARDGAEIRQLGRETGCVASRPQNVGLYFRPGITWTHTSRKGLSARLLPAGAICNVEAMAAFPTAGASDDTLTYAILALLNTPHAARLIEALNPTVHYGAREVRALPLPPLGGDAVACLATLARRAVAFARAASAEDETTLDFVAPPAWPDGLAAGSARTRALIHVEQDIAAEVERLYRARSEPAPTCDTDAVAPDGAHASTSVFGAELRQTSSRVSLPQWGSGWGAAPEVGCDGPPLRRIAYEVGTADTPHAAALVRPTAPEPSDAHALAVCWVSYAVGCAFGRFGTGAGPCRALAVLEPGHPHDLVAQVHDILVARLGAVPAERIVAQATGGRPLVRWLARDFFRWHLRRYRGRPLYWLLQSPTRRYSLYAYWHGMSRETLAQARGAGFLGGRIARISAACDTLHRTRGALARAPEARGRAHELEDLRAMDTALTAALTMRDERGAIVGWVPEPDDGVLINAAPLASLLPAWPREPQRCWEALAAGTLNWSRTARRYWPQRVHAACAVNRSYALAHGWTGDQGNKPRHEQAQTALGGD